VRATDAPVTSYGGLWLASPAHPKIGQSLNGGYGWLQVRCRRCATYASIPLEHIRRPPDTPIWKLRSNADRAGRRSTRRRHT
jgi:hypothetical protein